MPPQVIPYQSVQDLLALYLQQSATPGPPGAPPEPQPSGLGGLAALATKRPAAGTAIKMDKRVAPQDEIVWTPDKKYWRKRGVNQWSPASTYRPEGM